MKGEIIEGVLHASHAAVRRTRGRSSTSGAASAARSATAVGGQAAFGSFPARTLTAYRLESGRWLELGVYGDEREARVEPFDAVALDVSSFWT